MRFSDDRDRSRERVAEERGATGVSGGVYEDEVGVEARLRLTLTAAAEAVLRVKFFPSAEALRRPSATGAGCTRKKGLDSAAESRVWGFLPLDGMTSRSRCGPGRTCSNANGDWPDAWAQFVAVCLK